MLPDPELHRVTLRAVLRQALRLLPQLCDYHLTIDRHRPVPHEQPSWQVLAIFGLGGQARSPHASPMQLNKY
jgi:hypothetical protein